MKAKVITKKVGIEKNSLPQNVRAVIAEKVTDTAKNEIINKVVVETSTETENKIIPLQQEQPVTKETVLNTVSQFVVPMPTAEEKIIKVKQFEALSERYQLLKEKSNDLRLFEAGNDQTNAKIMLINSAGFQFEVRNSKVIEKVQNCMQEELDKLLHIAQERVLNFTL
ncbi:MAG: hypothetical protein BGO88_04895 [Flavobacterium sp. 38-13]|uniref:hypothetical protein n=1 Tax=Flavobacterium sp. 38-13 TaxID=1896168 RepID=UPI00095E1996|nr:hypothetical protein [Flavobacterium sp. 38-13]OJX55555.1 MAG: hypothetical protein BGO88_04895 [Flavobacterium sp. 38-13]